MQKRNIGPRQQHRQKRRKQQRVAFASLVTQAARNMARKYRRQRTKQRGGSLLSSIAGRIANIGAKNLFKWRMDIESKAISSEIGKKTNWWGNKLYRHGTSKNIRNALDSDVANYIVNETQKKAENVENLFGGIYKEKWLKELVIFK